MSALEGLKLASDPLFMSNSSGDRLEMSIDMAVIASLNRGRMAAKLLNQALTDPVLWRAGEGSRQAITQLNHLVLYLIMPVNCL